MTQRLELRGISKAFDDESGLHDVNITLEGEEILALLGPSGCGKTTLLRIIAGLERPDQGVVVFDDMVMNSVPPHRRGFGLMFQDYALFPHLNVFENIAYGLHIAGFSVTDQAARVTHLLRLVGLEGFATRDVAGLSGGEKQRVALARSLAPRPRLIMLDEPLAALDRSLRDHLGLEIKKILTEVGIPAILVTHDQSEAFAMARRVAVLHQGRIVQCDTPEHIYEFPVNAVVAEFLGLTNVCRAGRLFDFVRAHIGPATTYLLRPDAASLQNDASGPDVTARVLENVFRGQHTRIRFQVLDSEVVFHFPHPLPEGKIVQLRLDFTRIAPLSS